MNSELEKLVLLNLHHILGFSLSRGMSYDKHMWKRTASKNCYYCKKYLTHTQRTIDHVIPKNLALAIEHPELVYDHRNWVVSCLNCNLKKTNTVPKVDNLPSKTIDLLRELGYPC